MEEEDYDQKEEEEEEKEEEGGIFVLGRKTETELAQTLSQTLTADISKDVEELKETKSHPDDFEGNLRAFGMLKIRENEESQ